mgnify:CR=1 FL=1
MALSRREFLQLLGVAAAAGMTLDSAEVLAGSSADHLYQVPKFGNVHLLHFTDCHAQLLPMYFREPSMNLGIGSAAGKLPHLVGENLLKHVGMNPSTAEALDLSRWKLRNKNLEYYTSLSLLETSTSNLLVRSGTTGQNRFKNGILVDPFKGHDVGNTLHPQYSIAVDAKVFEASKHGPLACVDCHKDLATVSDFSAVVCPTGPSVTAPLPEFQFSTSAGPT